MGITKSAVLAGRTAALALGVLSIATQAAAGMCVDLNVRFKGLTPSPALVESMRTEVESIWQPYGVRLEWPTETGSAACTASQGSFDVLVDHPRPHGSPSKIVLGRTHLTPGAIDHVPIYVDHEATEYLLECLSRDQVVRALGRLRVEAGDVGRALGRVLAHEIGHIILAAPRHQPRGLMRESFLAHDLIRPERDRYTLSDAEVIRLRQREVDLCGDCS